MMNTFDTLSQLCNAAGVSGAENAVAQKAVELLQPYGEVVITPALGNVMCSVGTFDDKKPTVILDAHMDEIGMIVTYITDDGFLKVSGCGGIDCRILLGQQVTIYGKEKLIGIVTSTPPHLEKDSSAAPEIDEIYIDTGLDVEKAKELISLGDIVLIENELEKLQGNRVTAKAIDDRSGMTAIILALELLKDRETLYNIVVLFSSQEETGERGAATGGFLSKASMAIVVDVSFAKTHGESDENCAIMGKGPMIGFAPSLSREMSENFKKIAEKKKIPYQIEVMNGKTGTNADAIGISECGKTVVTVSIPEKHMHTPVEIVDLKDIENTAALIAEYLCNYGSVGEVLV